jgi:transposase
MNKPIAPTTEHGDVQEIRLVLRHCGQDVGLYRRLQGICFRLEQKSVAETLRLVGVTRSTLREWIKLWNAGGVDALRTVPRTGRPRQLIPEVQDLVVQEIEGKLAEGKPYRALILHGTLKKKDRT